MFGSAPARLRGPIPTARSEDEARCRCEAGERPNRRVEKDPARGLARVPADQDRLAQVRLKQNRLEEAASLASRSNSFVGARYRLAADNWRLIAEVRARQGRGEESRRAADRAARLAERAR